MNDLQDNPSEGGDGGAEGVIDPLTFLPNRDALTERVADEAARARRYKRPLSLAVAAVGDEAPGGETLRRLAVLLLSSARDTDFVARVGPSAFAILLPDTDSGNAQHCARRLRERIEAAALGDEATPLRLTARVGLAVFTPADDSGADDLLERAEQALHRENG